MNSSIFHYVFQVAMAAACTGFAILSPSLHAQENHTDARALEVRDLDVHMLDDKLQAITADIVALERNPSDRRCLKVGGVNELVKQLKRLAGTPVIAARCVQSNLTLLEEEIDHDLIADVAWYLYQNNAHVIAEKLVDISRDNFSEYTQSRIQFQYAKHLFADERWKETIVTLQGIEIELTLKQHEADYAYFMTGVSLQNLQQHRDALKVYKAIGIESEYYTFAQINAAVANIRQGWWTDAHILLNAAIKRETKKKNFVLVDRLHLMIGYSQLQNEFYRDARESFRNIGIKSPYANRAMIGMGLAAMHQKDYKSARNTFKVLANKQPDDIYVQQAYLLLPYAHEKLGNKRLSEAKYTEAAAYYQKKIFALKQPQPTSEDLPNIAFDIAMTANLEVDGQLGVSEAFAVVSQLRPMKISEKIEQLKLLKSYAEGNSLMRLNALRAQYLKLKTQEQRGLIDNAQAIYQSYINQCQYALARLYDDEL